MQQITDVALFPSYQLHLCKGNSGQNHQLLTTTAPSGTHFVQSSSEKIKCQKTQKAFSSFYFLIPCQLFSSITETIICLTRQHGVFANNLKTSSFGISSFSLFSWPLVWLKLFFVLFKSSMDSLDSYVAHVWGEERLVHSKSVIYILSVLFFRLWYMSWEICTGPGWAPLGSWGSTDAFAHSLSLSHITVRDNLVLRFF